MSGLLHLISLLNSQRGRVKVSYGIISETRFLGTISVDQNMTHSPIDLKRITGYKLALIFESANHRKFLSLFGSEAARLSTYNETTLEGYTIKHVFDHCDSIMKNVINKKTKTKRQ
jgi:hypothetical protein